MGLFACPKGHQSDDQDYCSECGAKMAGVPAAAPVVTAPVVPQLDKCPDCGTDRERDDITFCEICGYNFSHAPQGGEIAKVAAPPPPRVAPVAVVAVSAPPRGWAVTVSVDPALHEAGSPAPPEGVGPFEFALKMPVNLIGRRSEARAIFPDVPLTCDDAVSHRHALLQVGPDGGLSLRDIGASNGTRLNGQDVKPMVDHPLKDGDVITLGHWSRIVVKAVE